MRTYNPSKEDVHELAKHGNLVPIWRELPADLETPVSVYLKLRGQGSGSFLLESVEKAEHVGRYSFLGCDPSGLLVASDGQVSMWEDGTARPALQIEGDPLAAAEKILSRYQPVPVNGLPRFCGGLVGYLGYDTVRYFEPVPLGDGPGIGLPDAVFMLADSLVIFDHVKHRLLVVANAHINGDPAAAYAAATAKIDHIVVCLHDPIPARAMAGETPSHAREPDWESNFDQSSFEAMVRTAKEYIAAGDIFQVVLSQRLSRRTAADPFSIYRALRMVNPSPYMFFLELPGDVRLVGTSPEMLTRLDERTAEVRPIAGTRPRGANPVEDDALADELLADPKERAEHVMLVDLGRNDLGRVCRYGTVHVPEMMGIERYSHVMHIVSDVQGEIRDDLGAFDLLRATFPAGTVSGAPKVRAMEIIAELEGERRAHYAGAIGYIGYSGNMDTCIAIRTIAMRGNTVHVQAGAGIVADSDPTREYHETLSKAKALAEAVNIAETEDWTAAV
jgi:anthranilate synthase component 1